MCETTKQLEATLLARLEARGMTLATAESCTGGLIAKRLTDVPGASAVYLGGVVSYANEVKAALLHVDRAALERFGAVSAEVAAQMARGVRQVTGASVAVSTTGIAGPGGGTPTKPVGTVWVGISTQAGEETHLLQLDPTADRATIRKAAATRALSLLLDRVR